MKCAVFDTETTGIPKHPHAKIEIQPRVIEFGGAVVNEEGEVLKELELLFNPQEPLEEIITKITGLRDEDLADQPTFPQLFDQIADFFDGCDAVIAHNLPFDMTIIELECARKGGAPLRWPAIQVCTVQEEAERWGRRPKLQELYLECKGEKLDQKHRALDDVMALVEVCKDKGILYEINTAIKSQN